jgi:hypothetical protein
MGWNQSCLRVSLPLCSLVQTGTRSRMQRQSKAVGIGLCPVSSHKMK